MIVEIFAWIYLAFLKLEVRVETFFLRPAVEKKELSLHLAKVFCSSMTIVLGELAIAAKLGLTLSFWHCCTGRAI